MEETRIATRLRIIVLSMKLASRIQRLWAGKPKNEVFASIFNR